VQRVHQVDERAASAARPSVSFYVGSRAPWPVRVARNHALAVENEAATSQWRIPGAHMMHVAI
jgi:hypothetical protein